MLEAFAEVVGQGDPVTAAEAYWMQLAATLQAGSGPTGVCGAGCVGGFERCMCVLGAHKGLSVVRGGAWLSFGGYMCTCASTPTGRVCVLLRCICLMLLRRFCRPVPSKVPHPFEQRQPCSSSGSSDGSSRHQRPPGRRQPGCCDWLCAGLWQPRSRTGGSCDAWLAATGCWQRACCQSL